MLASDHMRLALFAGLIAACSAPPNCEFTTTESKTYAVDAISLPTSSNDFAYDLNGDGYPDDRMGNLLGLLVENMINVQDTVNSAVNGGTLGFNIQVVTGSPGGGRLATLGETAPTSSSATFCTSPSHPTSQSPLPAKLDQPPTITMHLPFVLGLPAQATAVHLRLQDRSDGGISGQLNVAFGRNSIETVVIPSFAQMLTSEPTSCISKWLDEETYEDGSGCKTSADCTFSTAGCTLTAPMTVTIPSSTADCRNPNYGSRPSQCANPCDGVIDTCEVAGSMLLKNLLAPELRLFADDGVTWSPSPDNMHKDSLSFGFGFTAKAL